MFIIPALLESGAALCREEQYRTLERTGTLQPQSQSEFSSGPWGKCAHPQDGLVGGPCRFVAGMSEACMIISEEEKEKKSAMFPSNAMAAARSQASSSLTWNITNPPQSAPHAPCTAQLACSCPAGETPQALIASRIESKLFPRGQGPSYSHRICLSVFIPLCNCSGALT